MILIQKIDVGIILKHIMTKESEKIYLDPKEQLELAAKVSRIYELEPGGFMPEEHLPDVKTIVRTLDPRLKPWKAAFVAELKSKSDSAIASGATNLGNVNTSFQKEDIKKFQLGVQEYKIGSHVVVKLKRRKLNYLLLEHFWNRGAKTISEDDPPVTAIQYKPNNLEIKKVIKKYPYRIFVGPITIMRFKDVTMWKD